MSLKRTLLMRALCGVLMISAAVSSMASQPVSWNLSALQNAPSVYPSPEGLAVPEGVRAVCFEGPAYLGKATRVFAYYGIPADASAARRVPGIVLVHGAGATAFADWVKLWVSRGYAAIAFDTEGDFPVGHSNAWAHNPEGGPRRSDIAGLKQPITDQWMYHAVANAILAHSLLRSFPEVDGERIGITGISWGGVVVSNVAGIDSRLKFAVPVYGCGFLGENTDDGSRFIGVNKSWTEVGEQVTAWTQLWDPSQFLPKAQLPMLWISGVNDFAFTPRARQLSYQAAPGPHWLSLRIGMPHGHGGPGESPEEIRAFADSLVNHGEPLLSITSQGHEAMQAWVKYSAKVPLKRAELLFTRGTGRWQDRKWETQPASFTENQVSAAVPQDAVAYFFNLIDARGLMVSSEHQMLK